MSQPKRTTEVRPGVLPDVRPHAGRSGGRQRRRAQRDRPGRDVPGDRRAELRARGDRDGVRVCAAAVRGGVGLAAVGGRGGDPAGARARHRGGAGTVRLPSARGPGQRPGADPGRLHRRLRAAGGRRGTAVGPGSAGRRAGADVGGALGPAGGGAAAGGRGRRGDPLDALRPGTACRGRRPPTGGPRRYRRGPGGGGGLGVRLVHGGPDGRAAGPVRAPGPVRHAAAGHGGGRGRGGRADAQPAGRRADSAGHRGGAEPADAAAPDGLGRPAPPGRQHEPLRRRPADRGPGPPWYRHPRRAPPLRHRARADPSGRLDRGDGPLPAPPGLRGLGPAYVGAGAGAGRGAALPGRRHRPRRSDLPGAGGVRGPRRPVHGPAGGGQLPRPPRLPELAALALAVVLVAPSASSPAGRRSAAGAWPWRWLPSRSASA